MGLVSGEAPPEGTTIRSTSQPGGAGDGRRSRGQILVASSTAELVDGVGLIDLGYGACETSRRRCRYQVFTEGLSDDFPPLKTVDAVPGNLPTPTTSCIGRDDQNAELVALVGQSRQVTLAGVGGVGKTSLSIGWRPS